MSDRIVVDGEVSIVIPADGECASVINVGHEIITEQLSVAQNGVYEPDTGVDGFSLVRVEVPEPAHATETWVFTLDDDTTVTKVVILDD